MEKFNKYYKNRQVLVTGGAGFIGSQITQQLVDAGAQVTILDNFSSGTVANLDQVIHHIKVIAGDITDPKACEYAARGKSHIFHLAAAISVVESQQNPDKYQKINVEGTKNILTAAVNARAQRLVFSSSAAVYGNQEEACSEQLILAPNSPYAETKIAGENLCTFFKEKYGLESVILRYFNVHGPKQRSDGGYAAVIPTFLQKLQQNLPLTIFGNGQQTRDFISVEEIAEANLIAGCMKKIPDPIINVASGQSKSILELIEELTKKLGCPKPLIEFLPERPGDILHSKANCGRYFTLKKEFENLYVAS